MEGSVSKDVNARHVNGELPADPMQGARATNRAARDQALKDQAKPVSIRDMFAEIVTLAKEAKPAMGASLGHFKLDKYLAGLRRGNIATLGARTSFGKTSKALHVADLYAEAKGRPLFISCEDSRVLCARRFMAMRANINALRLRSNVCRAQEIEKMSKQLTAAETFPFFSNGIGVPVEDLTDLIREHCRREGTGLVIVDYLQCIKSRRRHQDRKNEVTYISAELGEAIKQANAAGLLLSQMRRPQAGMHNKPPTMDELKESGDIENASEHVILGWAEEVPHQTDKTLPPTRVRKVQIAKNKDGPVPDEWIDLEFNSFSASFTTVKAPADPRMAEYDEFDDFAEEGAFN